MMYKRWACSRIGGVDFGLRVGVAEASTICVCQAAVKEVTCDVQIVQSGSVMKRTTL